MESVLVYLLVAMTFAILGLFGLILTWAVFGKLIMVQLKRWTLKNKGYIEVEHVAETGVRNYFVMKPKDYKFDFNTGFYHYQPDAITKTAEVLKEYKGFEKVLPSAEELEQMPPDKRKEFLDTFKAEQAQLKEWAEVLNPLKYKPEAMSTRWGMPVITYYGDRPDPILFKDLKKEYGAGVIRDMFLRLLLTQRYQDFRNFLIGMMLIALVAVVAQVGFYMAYQGLSRSFAQCVATNNATATYLMQYLNESAHIASMNSTIVV